MEKKAKKRKSPFSVPHYVSYIDILGYSQKLKNKSPEEEVDFFKSIKLAFRDAKRVAQDSEMDFPSGIEINLFSDNIVLSVPESNTNAFHVICRYSWAMQRSLVRHGLLCRGGISRGMFYQNPEYVFGGGLIKAYSLESSQAIFPRIILDRELNDSLKNPTQIPLLFEHDSDGFYYIDYLIEPRQEIAHDNDCRIMHDHFHLLKNELSKQDNSVVTQKLLWSVTYHNKIASLHHEAYIIPNTISHLQIEVDLPK